MIDKKIIYKDPGEHEISAIVDFSDKSQVHSKVKTGKFNGRDVQHIEGNINQTIKKIDDLTLDAVDLKQT